MVAILLLGGFTAEGTTTYGRLHVELSSIADDNEDLIINTLRVINGDVSANSYSP